MLYPVAIYEDGANFTAQVPDLPNLTITGESMADVIRNARVIISEHLQSLTDAGEDVPSANDLSVHLDNAAFYGCVWAIVSLDSENFAKTMVTFPLNLPKKVLDAICQQLDNTDNETIQALSLIHI